MEDGSQKYPTVFEIASDIGVVDLDARGRGNTKRASKNKFVTDGLTPKPFPMKEGYYEVTPEQLASLKVPVITVGEKVTGFQRDARQSKAHARDMAKAMRDGEEFPPIIVSITKNSVTGEEEAIVSDGQHRSVAAIISRTSCEVVVKERDETPAKNLFSNQTKSKRIRHDHTLLTGDSPLEIYIQDALTSDDHPWSDMISDPESARDKRRMTPVTAATMIGAYVFDAMSAGVNNYIKRSHEGFDTARADELAELIKAFGNKMTNPDAFRSRSLKSTTYAAIYIFHRNPAVKASDRKRWMEWMPRFAFRDYAHLWNNEQQLAQALVAHWNKRLPAERKVEVMVYR